MADRSGVAHESAIGLDAVRSVDPARYALSGRSPRLALRPESRDEVAEAMRAAARERLAVVPWGAGVALSAEPAPPRYDLAIDLSGLARIVEYDPEDLTLTAEAGASIGSLREALAAHRQELPLEAAQAGRATLGGLLAADASGSRRLRFGAPHDRILGARFVLADGAPARSGGRVVKNVAGYATHRLLCGSRGALAVFVEASLKLAPAPDERVALCFGMDAAAISDLSRWGGLARLEPAFASVVGVRSAALLPPPAAPGAAFTLIVGLEDDRPRVAEQEAAVIRALGPPQARLSGGEVVAIAQALADLEEQPGPRLTLTAAANTPAALAALLESPAAGRLIFHAPAGRLHLFPEAGEAAAVAVAATACGFTPRAARGVGEPADAAA
ncbi:MAG: FAD-binding oxidoreductase, partial [Candidatus Eiseniibacteriota bacterium]